MKVGFIGLGRMGLPMARNLVKARHAVTVYNRTRERAEMLQAEGAVVASQPSEACSGDVLITMLANDQAVNDVIFGSELIGRLPHGSVHVSMSTISVALAERLAADHRSAGKDFVSAPVFGRPEAAEAAQLAIVVAGPPEAVARCKPLFDAMGQRTFIVGEDAPKANTVKLAGNFLIASAIESLGEAYALLRKSGVEPERFLEVMTSTLFAAPAYRTYGNLIARGQFEPAGFKVPLGLKDISLVLAAAEAVSAPMPIASLVRDHLLTAMARGRKEQDWSSLAQVPAENAGLE
ncbi:MAG: NAD(P)-dependent oxidoreductase [Acidobacteria bacterium]|nr:NAD(P)-dependent oxidoreductase [Acidobacteriota bacterium]